MASGLYGICDLLGLLFYLGFVRRFGFGGNFRSFFSPLLGPGALQAGVGDLHAQDGHRVDVVLDVVLGQGLALGWVELGFGVHGLGVGVDERLGGGGVGR